MIVSASAGAGKTHTLAMRLVQLLLSPVIPKNGLKNILAITFTNAAAAEMRQRVLRFLKLISLDPAGATAVDARTIISLDGEALALRAAATLEAILSHYGDFQIRTIDSFMTRVFKGSALEFGFQPEFEVVMDQLPLIAAAFDAYMRGALADEQSMRDLRQVVHLLTEQADGDRSFPWDPYTRMVLQVSNIMRTLATRTVTLSDTDRSAELEDELSQARVIGCRLEESVRASGLVMNRYLADDLSVLGGPGWRALLGRTEKSGVVNKPRTAVEKKAFDGAEPELRDLLDRFNGARHQLARLEAAAYFRPFVVALRTVASTIEDSKRRKGTLAIDDVNRMLVEYLASGAVPDIYISLGERIAHYLIDEFQDTSPVQWAALRVLIENALAEGGTLFAVGDTKQSIYGFRGADWRIMKDLLDGKELLNGSPVLRASLDRNFRSGEAIVSFSREVFHALADTPLAGPAALSGLHDYLQEPAEGLRGKGHVEVLHLQKTTPPSEPDALIGLIRDAVRRGCRYGDIAVLTPSNRAVLDISGWLNGAAIPFLSHSSLDIRTRKITAELLALLSFLDSPVDDLAFASCILGDVFTALCRREFTGLDCAAMRQFILECRGASPRLLYSRFRQEFPDAWERCFDRLFSAVGHLPLYDLVCEIFKTFDLLNLAPREQSGLVRFLEVVKDFEARGNNSLKGFLAFADDETDETPWSIERQQNPEAVTVMTVHKAKGLQFPVVIALLYDTEKHPSSMVFHQAENGIELWHLTQQGSAGVPGLEEEYRRELALTRADELNRLYVTLTRAEAELYVICVSNGDPKFPAAILPASGDPAARPARPGPPSASPALAGIRPAPHTLRLPAPRLDDRPIGFFETRRGDYFHEALAKLEYLEDETGTLLSPVLPGRMPDGLESPETAMEQVLAFLNLEEVRPWFTRREGRTVLTEQEFLSRSGALYRVDRLVVDPDEVTVIDFKTGTERGEDAYREQVSNYMEILRDIFPDRRVRGAIAYIDGLHVADVLPPAPGLL